VDEANIRIVITGGSSPDFLTPSGNPRLIVMVTPIKKLPEEWYTHGVKVITLVQERPLAGAKVTAYIPAAMALKEAHAAGAVEAIYVNPGKPGPGRNHQQPVRIFRHHPDHPAGKRNFKRHHPETDFVPCRPVFSGYMKNPFYWTGFWQRMRCLSPAPIKAWYRSYRLTRPGSNGTPGSNTQKLIQALDRHTRDFSSRKPVKSRRTHQFCICLAHN
jgi:hypothetical protein